MVRTGEPAYYRGMETQAEIVTRWRYLRQLLIEQLAQRKHTLAPDVDVHQCGVELTRFGQQPRSRHVRRGSDHLAAELVQHVGRERPDDRRILDDEDAPPGEPGV